MENWKVEPEGIIEKIRWWTAKIEATNRAMDDPIVFEYLPQLPKDKAYLMDRSQFEDMRHRVFLSPDWEPEVEKFQKVRKSESQ